MDSDLSQWIKNHNQKVYNQRDMDQLQKPIWMSEAWYHGAVDRASTESLLAGRRPGLFLVRDSSSCPGDYVLSVSENSKVSHYIISRRGGMYLIGDQSFEELPEVIEFYKKHFLDTTTLTECAPNPRPMQTTAGQAVTEQIDSRDAQLPPPVPVIGRLLAKGKFDFKSDDPEDLSFKKGDILTVLRKDEDEWWFAQHENGRQGSIPVPYIQIVEDNSQPFLARAIMDRECPYDQTALSFKSGELIMVTKQNENGVWEGELNGRRGHFPFKLVEVVDANSH
ncbi:crk-like protein [Halichondria panicea]|uniref:crk-like protein n=1 Tax=Halichondria panicea TaxID=6063 RepID=UPI00312B3C96